MTRKCACLCLNLCKFIDHLKMWAIDCLMFKRWKEAGWALGLIRLELHKNSFCSFDKLWMSLTPTQFVSWDKSLDLKCVKSLCRVLCVSLLTFLLLLCGSEDIMGDLKAGLLTDGINRPKAGG